MKVACIREPGGLENICIEDRPKPSPGVGEVLVRVRASSLNFHDLGVATGRLPFADGRILMSDGAGEVVAVGGGVTEWSIGDRVVSTFFPTWQAGELAAANLRVIPGDSVDGFAAEFVAAPSTGLTRIPEGFSFVEAATLPCAALTAWHAVMVKGRTKPGDQVLVQGSGGVSIFALQFAKAAGAGVIATSSSDAKLEKLRTLGADECINYRETPAWGRVASTRSGGGVDLVVDVGGPDTLTESMAACRIGGQIASIGVLSGRVAELSVPAIFGASLCLQGIAVGSVTMQRDMLRAIDQNGMRPVIDQSFSLDDLARAFEYQVSQGHFGKIVVEV